MQATPMPAGEPPHDHAPGGVRERVRAAAADSWRAPVRVLYLRKVRTNYRVPGRWYDGKGKGQRNFLVDLVGLVIYLLLMLVDMAVDAVLELFGASNLRSYSNLAGLAFSRRGEVRGRAENCAAVRMGDAANAAHRDLWLVWSDRHVALVHATEHEEQRVLHMEPGPALPILNSDARPKSSKEFTLSWPDDSSIALYVDRHERRRFHDFHGLR